MNLCDILCKSFNTLFKQRLLKDVNDLEQLFFDEDSCNTSFVKIIQAKKRLGKFSEVYSKFRTQRECGKSKL